MAFDETTKQAAIRLGQRLAGKQWYSSVGIGTENGRPILIIYLARSLGRDRQDVPEEWEEIPVRVQYMGRVTPAASAA